MEGGERKGGGWGEGGMHRGWGLVGVGGGGLAVLSYTQVKNFSRPARRKFWINYGVVGRVLVELYV